MLKKRSVMVMVHYVLLLFVIGNVSADCIVEAEALIVEKDYKKAVLVLEPCSEKAESWKMLGKAYHELFQMDQAKKYLEKHLELSPEDLESRILQASALAYNKEFRRAIERYRLLQKMHPENAEVLKGLAQALGWNKEYEAAIFLYRSVLKIDPKDYQASLEIAILLSWQKKFKESIAQLGSLIESRPEREWQISAMLQRAQVLSWQKKFNESLAEYRAVLVLEPAAIDAYLGIGTVLEWKGKYKDARANYEKALTADPQSTAVKNRLDQLMWVK